jgi:phosphate uptake regulator
LFPFLLLKTRAFDESSFIPLMKDSVFEQAKKAGEGPDIVQEEGVEQLLEWLLGVAPLLVTDSEEGVVTVDEEEEEEEGPELAPLFLEE